MIIVKYMPTTHSNTIPTIPEASSGSHDFFVQALGRSGLFANTQPSTFNRFAEQCQQRRYAKGTVLFLQEDEADWCYLIINGWVKLYRETLDGDEAVVDALTSGLMFGETAIFENGKYPYAAEVVEDATLLLLPIRLLAEQVKQDNQLAFNMLKIMSRFQRQQDKEIEHRTLQNAPQRIGCFLLRLCRAGAEGEIRLHLPYDKTLIASRLGMQPETFSRALGRLKNETGIKVQGSTVIVPSIESLSGYSCSACTSSYPCQDLY
ncbi:MAG: Crp/Fnr family transcriptional regulator [Rickettsiales bacterium]|nr:Crp/Fnr family transcriptional regulator [Rickettsiales bacterium]